MEDKGEEGEGEERSWGGRQLRTNGIHEAICASRLIQRGGVAPHNRRQNSEAKWLQFLHRNNLITTLQAHTLANITIT